MNKSNNIHDLSSLSYSIAAAALVFWGATSVARLMASLVHPSL